MIPSLMRPMEIDMKLIKIRRHDNDFYELADEIKEGIIHALEKFKHFDVVKEYEDTIKSVAFAVTEEIIERVAEVEERIKSND